MMMKHDRSRRGVFGVDIRSLEGLVLFFFFFVCLFFLRVSSWNLWTRRNERKFVSKSCFIDCKLLFVT